MTVRSRRLSGGRQMRVSGVWHEVTAGALGHRSEVPCTPSGAVRATASPVQLASAAEESRILRLDAQIAWRKFDERSEDQIGVSEARVVHRRIGDGDRLHPGGVSCLDAGGRVFYHGTE